MQSQNYESLQYAASPTACHLLPLGVKCSNTTTWRRKGRWRYRSTPSCSLATKSYLSCYYLSSNAVFFFHDKWFTIITPSVTNFPTLINFPAAKIHLQCSYYVNVERQDFLMLQCTLLWISEHTRCSSFLQLTLNIPRGVLRGPPLVCYWLTSLEINKHKIFDTNNAWITEL